MRRKLTGEPDPLFYASPKNASFREKMTFPETGQSKIDWFFLNLLKLEVLKKKMDFSEKSYILQHCADIKKWVFWLQVSGNVVLRSVRFMSSREQ